VQRDFTGTRRSASGSSISRPAAMSALSAGPASVASMGPELPDEPQPRRHRLGAALVLVLNRLLEVGPAAENRHRIAAHRLDELSAFLEAHASESGDVVFDFRAQRAASLGETLKKMSCTIGGHARTLARPLPHGPFQPAPCPLPSRMCQGPTSRAHGLRQKLKRNERGHGGASDRSEIKRIGEFQASSQGSVSAQPEAKPLEWNPRGQ
jgi:hypothetical protein